MFVSAINAGWCRSTTSGPARSAREEAPGQPQRTFLERSEGHNEAAEEQRLAAFHLREYTQ